MTQTATARPLQRSTTRPAGRQPLRVVRPQPASGQPLFVGACLALLVAGLIGVLMLNTAMAKGSFVLGDLQDTSNQLSATEEELSHAIDAQSTQAELATRALSMGMLPSETAAFLRLSDGKVLGVAEAPEAKKEFTVATQGSSAAAAARPSTTPKTTVKTVGTVTTTTVTTVKGDTIEVTTTSVDSRTAETSTKTTTRPVPPPAAAPTPSATPSATPTKGAAPPAKPKPTTPKPTTPKATKPTSAHPTPSPTR